MHLARLAYVVQKASFARLVHLARLVYVVQKVHLARLVYLAYVVQEVRLASLVRFTRLVHCARLAYSGCVAQGAKRGKDTAAAVPWWGRDVVGLCAATARCAVPGITGWSGGLRVQHLCGGKV